MNAILSSGRRHYLIIVNIVIVTLALIAGMPGCAAPPVPQYELTISSTEGGSVAAPGEGAFFYGEGTVVSLLAEAGEGYLFVGWTGDVNAITNRYSASTMITVNGEYSITATFEEIPAPPYELSISSTVGGSIVSPGEGTFAYDPSSVVSIVAQADEGYQFINWTGDVTAIADVDAPATTITMSGDYTINASFEEVEEHEIVTFNDPNLEAAIREAIAKPEGPIYAQDMAELTTLSAEESGISDLAGLEHAVNLQSLNLCCNQISDISPLSSLTGLTELSLDGNEITDVSPLLQNEGLGEGDVVYLRGDPLSWDSVNVYIPELRARGVTVVYDEEGIPGTVIVEPPCEIMIAEYTITFDIAADLHSGTHSITIRFPEGTTVPQTAWQTGDITVNGQDVFGLEITVVGTKVTFLVPQHVASGTVTVVFKEDAGIVNPPAGWYYIYVNTSRAPDSTPRRIGPY